MSKKQSGYRVQHWDGNMWRGVTKPVTNKRVAFALADKLGDGYRVQNVYTGAPATRPT